MSRPRDRPGYKANRHSDYTDWARRSSCTPSARKPIFRLANQLSDFHLPFRHVIALHQRAEVAVGNPILSSGKHARNCLSRCTW